jgi:ankyrin repeat protein
VLQEVAAARNIVIVCGSTEIDGYAFCLGLEAFKGFDQAQVDLLNLARSVTYLMKDSIFRPNFSISNLDRFTLNISPLRELVDMYHDRMATKSNDKVYALLGMSSDRPSDTVGLLPDYGVPWEELFKRLIHFILHDKVFVEIWSGESVVAVIKSEGYILGKVSMASPLPGVDHDEGDGTGFMLESKGKRVRWATQASAKPVQNGDIVCSLRGASRPTIIRPRYDYFDIIVIAAVRPKDCLPYPHPDSFIRDFLLVWDWSKSVKKAPRPERYEHLLQGKEEVLRLTTALEGQPNSEFSDHLVMPNRIWDASLVLGDVDQYEEAETRLQEAIEGYGTVFKVAPRRLKSQYGLTPLSWAAGNGYIAVVRELFAKGRGKLDAGLKDSQYSQAPLSWAAENGHEEVVKLLLEISELNVNTRCHDGHTPLLWAARNGHVAVVKLLLDTGKVDVMARDKFGETPLIWAVKNGHDVVVKLLVDTGKVNVKEGDKNGQSLLLLAVQGGYVAIAKLLIDIGKVDIDERDVNERPLLLLAVQEGYEAIVKLLLDTQVKIETTALYGGSQRKFLLKRVNADARDKDKLTSLLVAARDGRESIVKLLLDKVPIDDIIKYKDRRTARFNWTGMYDVDIEAMDKDNLTPLSWAAKNGHDVIVELLLNTGIVEVEARDKDGQTPLLWAAKNGHEAVAKLLLDIGKADIKAKDQDKKTPLLHAAENGNEAVVKLLISTGKVNLKGKDKNGQTPLLWAAQQGHEAVIKLLLDTNKVDVKEKNMRGHTALLLAARDGHEKIVKLLLDTGKVKVEAKDVDGNTALDWAGQGRHSEVIELLRSNARLSR